MRERLAAISSVGHRPPGIDRQILALAVPALGALVAEPLFVLVDSAVVGHLGTAPLAGLALASTVLMTVIGLCVFLAYATTAAVARRLGSGDRAGALQVGVDGMWLALGLGVVLAAVTWLSAPWLIDALGASDEVAQQAVTYLRWSAPGLPGMLLVLASTGALRGLLDTRTPLVVAATGAVVNAVLNIVLVYGVGMGIAGSGLGTALTQLAMAVALTVVVVRGARGSGAQLRPAAGGIWANARAGTPLFVRTLSLRLAILLTVWVATGLGAVELAGHQIVNAVWGLAAFALDALAIAAQALIGHGLGAADVPRVRAVLRRTLQWGVGAGAALGLVVGGLSWVYVPLFTTADDVRAAAVAALVVAAVTMPMAGWVFVLDGVLIGAGDGRFLAWAGMATFVVYVPFALAVRESAPPGAAGLAWLWAAFAGVFMLARAVTTGWRARGTAWMVTGA
ncbi:MATE family efflux transporter [Cellulomonas sp. Root485]|uniref:MATE family efflux transporter n=1 Tax=Cellulomonas sp. Root485 TaxID=1736546 RepID=UPI000700BF27|nr:MATE family efflux transporter [Cellulomonas sp. Root485]KQY23569.1 MATE family efflux transporter [Cellulomonas sp. Root485]